MAETAVVSAAAVNLETERLAPALLDDRMDNSQSVEVP